MCGITGIYRFDGERVQGAEIQRMMKLLHHRGPDGSGKHVLGNVGLGHTRLAIIDVACGLQPMTSRSGRYILIYNGEIYNYQELREDLQQRGVKFKTHSDTEVILEGYAKDGSALFEKLNGMFAFAILDTKTKELILCRDRLGIKPLYLYETEDALLFASEIKAFYGTSLFRPEVNKAAIKEYLTFSNLHSNISFFKGVRQLEPGTWMRVAGSKAEVHSYWESSYEKRKLTHEQYVEEYRKLCAAAVRRHMISEVPLGSYLSGGIDSSAVAATAAKLSEGRLHVFTGIFPETGKYSELEPAQAVAKQINAEHHVVTITPKDFRDSLQDVVYALDEPRVGMGAFPQYHVAKRASEEITVILTGHGGDELFAGYPLYRARLIRSFLRSPLASAKALVQTPLQEIPHVLYYLFYPLLQSEVQYGTFIMFSQKQQQHLLTDGFQKETAHHDSFAFIRSLAEKKLASEDRVQEIYLRTYLPALFIVEDKVGMAHSLESRTPLCDNTLLDFSQSIPLREKIHKGKLKSIPKDAFRGTLPSMLYKQPKKGFPTPLSLWFRGELRGFVEEILLSESFRKRGICKQQEVKKLLETHFRSRSDNLHDYVQAARIWALLNIEVWHRLYIDDVAAVRGRA